MDLKACHQTYVQSLWLDYILRHLLTCGELIAGSTDYEAAIRDFEGRRDATVVGTLDEARRQGRARARAVARETLMVEVPPTAEGLGRDPTAHRRRHVCDGVSIDELTDRLLDEGIRSFANEFDDIMSALEQKRAGC